MIQPIFVYAQTIDNFEDTDISEYTIPNGDSSDVSFITFSKDGTYSLELNLGPSFIPTIVSKSGLPNYPEPGDTFRYWVYPDGGRAVFQFGLQDANNQFAYRIDAPGDTIQLRKNVGGSGTVLTEKTLPLSLDQWYQVEIEWNEDNSWSTKLYNESGALLVKANTADTTFGAGGIGFRGINSDGSNSRVIYDFARLFIRPSIDTGTLSVGDGNDTLTQTKLDGSNTLGSTFNHTVQVQAQNSDTVNLYYRRDGAAATTADTKVTFTNTTGDTYEAILPDTDITDGDTVNFILEGIKSGFDTPLIADSGTVGFEYRVQNETPVINPDIVNQNDSEDADAWTIPLENRASDINDDPMKWVIADGGDTLVDVSLANNAFNATGEDTLSIAPDTNAHGSDSISLKLGDGQDTTTESFTVTIFDAPEITSIDPITPPSQTLRADSFVVQYTFNETVSGIDPSDISVLNFSGDASGSLNAVNTSSGDSVQVTIDSVSGDGVLQLNFSDDDGVVNDKGVPLGGIGTGGSDPGGGGLSTFYTIDNTPPSVKDDTATVNEDDPDSPVIGTLLDNDVDSTALSVSAVAGSSGNVGSAIPGDTGGLFTIVAGGTVSFDPNGDFEGLGLGETDTTGVDVTVRDTVGHEVTQRVRIIVKGSNDSPVINPPIPDVTDQEDTDPIVISLTDRASDTDNDTIKWTVVDGADTLVSDTLTNGEFVAGGEDTLTLTPVSDANGTSSITISLGDGYDTKTQEFQIVLTPVNDTPVIGTPVDKQTTSLNADTTFIDLNNRASDTEGDAMKWTVSGDGDTVEASVDGVYRVGGDDTLTIKPIMNKAGTETLTLRVGDGQDTTSQTLDVVVLDNVPPNAPDTTFQTVSDSPITFALPGNDPDAGDTIDQFPSNTSPLSGSLSGADSEPTYTPPNSSFSGTETFTYNAENSGGSDTGVVTIRVLEPAMVEISGLVAQSAGDSPLVAQEGGTFDVNVTYKNNGGADVAITRDTEDLNLVNGSDQTVTNNFERALQGPESFSVMGGQDTTVTWRFQFGDTLPEDSIGDIRANVDTTAMSAVEPLTNESRSVTFEDGILISGDNFLIISSAPDPVDTARSAWNMDTTNRKVQTIQIEAGVTDDDTDASGNGQSWVDTAAMSNDSRVLFVVDRTFVSERGSEELGSDFTQSSNPNYSFFRQSPDSFLNTVSRANSQLISSNDTELVPNTVVQVSIWLNQTGKPSNYMGDSLDESVEVTMTSVDFLGDVDQLKVAKLDTSTENWTVIDENPTVNGSPGNLTVTFTVSEDVGFSVFRVITAGVSTTTNSNEAIVYPNPFVPHDGDPSTGRYCGGVCGDGDGIHFGTASGDGFPDGTTLKVYTVTGELVTDFTTRQDGIIQWDARTRNGEKVASDVYIWVLDVAGGGTKNGKLSIVR
jgi:VCBS repeat-containing protein